MVKISQFVTKKEVSDILTLDAKALNLKRSEFCRLNTEQVYVALNTHAALIEDVVSDAQRAIAINQYLLSEYRAYGFVFVQRQLHTLLESFLEDVEVGTADFWRYFSRQGYNIVLYYLLDRDVTPSSVRRVCQVLSYLARFTLITDVVAEASIQKFLSVNTHCHNSEFCTGIPLVRYKERITGLNYGRPWLNKVELLKRYPSQYLLDIVKDEMEHVFGRRPINRVGHGGFSSGSTAEGVSDIPHKCALIAKKLDNYDGIFHHVTGALRTGREYPFDTGYPRLMAVPKSLDAKRIIAPEPATLAYHAQGALKALRTRFEQTGAMRFINQRDEFGNLVGQDTNRELARVGSADGSYCTIDLSSASDSIAKHIFFAVCPNALRPFFASYISWFVCYQENGQEKKVRLSTLFTSGNPLTWDTEAGYFLSIARAGTRLSGVKEWRSKCYSYGDDIEVPSEAYETVCDLLAIFGHKVNLTKSYARGWFRESCGGWYYEGEDVTPLFWPRSEIKPDVSGQVSLIKMQHRAIEYGFTAMADWLASYIRIAIPDMTVSPVGEACDDLWGPIDIHYSERISHYMVKARGKIQSNVCFEHWLYYQYLEYGPEYNSALDELLGVSCSRRDTYLSGRETRWMLQPPLYGQYRVK